MSPQGSHQAEFKAAFAWHQSPASSTVSTTPPNTSMRKKAMQKNSLITHRIVHISMHAYGMGARENQLWVSEAWKTTSEQRSKRTGGKEGRKQAEDRNFFSYLIPLSILLQKKVIQHFSTSPTVHPSSPKKPPSLTECSRTLALL